MPKCGIYKIENKINGKCYIGQSVNILRRWRTHKTIANNENHKYKDHPLYRAIHYYKIENFDFSILEECLCKELDEKEKYYIQKYNSFIPNGYNLNMGGQGNFYHGTILTKYQVDEIKDKLLNSNITEIELSNQYGISNDSISAINTGESWHDDNLNYPLRPKNVLKEKIRCKNCGKELDKKTITELCLDCYKIQRNKHIPDREILKQKIRKQSFEEIAREFGFKTGNTIKKWCKKLNLPYLRSEINKISDEDWNNL